MKKVLAILLVLVMVFSMVACGSKEEEKEDTMGDTMGGKLQAVFTENSSKTGEEVIQALKDCDAVDFMVDYIEVEQGFLNGFDVEISGFNKGYVLMPMIGTIPFVCYVFETDNAEGLLKDLTSAANPRWNICTEAAETVSKVSGNLVFFAMCPGDEE